MAEAGISVTPAQRIHQQPRIDKLVRKERIVGVSEERPAFHRPGGRVDLVVDGQQRPACDFLLCSAIEGIDSKLGARSFRRASTSPRLSSGMVKMTVMGSSCVITARVTAPADCTTLPGSTSRKPTRPEMGAVMWQKSDLHLVVLHRSLVVLYGALILQDELFLVVQGLLGNGVACPRRAVAFQVHLCLGEHIFVSLQRPLRL